MCGKLKQHSLSLLSELNDRTLTYRAFLTHLSPGTEMVTVLNAQLYLSKIESSLERFVESLVDEGLVAKEVPSEQDTTDSRAPLVFARTVTKTRSRR